MTTLLEQLRPEIAKALEKNRDKYDYPVHNPMVEPITVADKKFIGWVKEQTSKKSKKESSSDDQDT